MAPWRGNRRWWRAPCACKGGGGANGQVYVPGANLELHADGGLVHPRDDGTADLGTASRRWRGLYGRTLALTPDPGATALTATMGGLLRFRLTEGLTAPTAPRLLADGAALELDASSNVVAPARANALSLGNTSYPWTTVHATTGTIQPSAQEAKEALTPLDPQACLQAVKDVVWYDFRYQPPAFTPPAPAPEVAYDASDSNEVKAEKKAARDEAEAGALEAHARMLAETAPARHQRGFVFPAAQPRAGEEPLPQVPLLFGLDDRASVAPQADLATIGCGLQALIAQVEGLAVRLTALEGAAR